MLQNFDTTVGALKKLIPRFKDPYKITKKLRSNRYVAADIEGYQASQRPYRGHMRTGKHAPGEHDVLRFLRFRLVILCKALFLLYYL